MTGIVSFLANIIILIVIGLYFRQVMKSESTPNPAAWFIWVIITVMNTISYHAVAGSFVEWVLTLTSTIGLCSIFFYSLVRGKFAQIGKVEIVSLILAVAIGVFWQITGDAIRANLLLQVIFLISYIPIVIGLARGQLRERTPPWDLAVVAYALMIVTILLNWSDGSWLALAHPIANGLLGNGSVALTIRLVQRRASA